MNEGKKRIKWVDTMRGIAMILVIYGHIDGSSHTGQFIYMFHVPAFFFISGYLFNSKLNFREYISKRVCRLLIPFFMFGMTIILINWGFHIVLGVPYDGFDFIKDMIFQIRGTDSRIWFLPCLFLAECVMALVFTIRKRCIQWILFILIILGGWLNVVKFHRDLPWYPDTAAIAISLMIIGYLLRKWKHQDLLLSPIPCVCSSIICIGTFLVNLKMGYRIDMVMNQYGNFILFYSGALSGIVLLINISNLLSNSILEYIGKSTICFLCLNSVAIKIVEKGITLLGTVTQTIYTKFNIVFPWEVTVLVVVVLIPSSFLINKYFPLYTGNIKCNWRK